MSDILNSKPGIVATLEDQFVIPGRVAIEGFEPQLALITGINANQKTDQQFQTSLARKVYIYVFGDQMGRLVVEGLAFPGSCENIGGTIGLIEVLNFYKERRASVNPAPVQVYIGSDDNVETGYLTEVDIQSKAVGDDPASFFSRWTMVINALPRT